uniref:Uncharacterized protein n=1 Tax=Cacopsylla melanoneura TaxID=428564 RepID=A0A8D8U459_9HEMI
MEEVMTTKQSLLKYKEHEAHCVPSQTNLFHGHLTVSFDFLRRSKLLYTEYSKQLHKPAGMHLNLIHEDAARDLKNGLHENDKHIVANHRVPPPENNIHRPQIEIIPLPQEYERSHQVS